MQQLKDLSEQKDDREALVKQLQEKVKQLDNQVDHLVKEKEARELQLQGRIDELENHIQRLETEREAREQEARAVVRAPRRRPRILGKDGRRSTCPRAARRRAAGHE